MEELPEYQNIIIEYNNAKGFACCILFNYYLAKFTNSLKILLPCIKEGMWYSFLCYTKILRFSSCKKTLRAFYQKNPELVIVKLLKET